MKDQAPKHKKEYISAVAKQLIKRHKKKSFYSAKEVDFAHYRSGWKSILPHPAWAMSIFCEKEEFDKWQDFVKRDRDYQKMRNEMLQNRSEIKSWTEIEGLDLKKHFIDYVMNFIRMLPH